MIIFKNKKYIIILFLLLALLILPRIAVYSMFGKGIVSTDAERRYFPQVEELSESLSNFFHQNGPFYSLFLLSFDKIGSDLVAGPVAIQHILGIITALLAFCYFKRINLALAFFVTVFTYSSWVALWIEHTVLRDSLAAFFFVLMIFLITLSVKKEKYFKFYLAVPAGLLGILLVFTRMEFVVLFLLIPLILFIVKKRWLSDLKIFDKRFLKWSFGYFLPVLIVLVMYLVVSPPASQMDTPYGSYFKIAHLNLVSEAYYYEGSQYPELLKEYQGVLEDYGEKIKSNDKNREIIGKFHGITEEYLLEHPELDRSMFQIMDEIYIEVMTKNTLVYTKSFFINVKNQILGIAELNSLITKYELSESSGVDSALRNYNISMVWFSIVLFWLSLISLPFLFIKWKKLPPELVISFFISAIQIAILAFLTDANHRFKYPIDPFIYFLQFYLIIILLKVLFSKFKGGIVSENKLI